jgi:hypothetical protein
MITRLLEVNVTVKPANIGLQHSCKKESKAGCVQAIAVLLLLSAMWLCRVGTDTAGAKVAHHQIILNGQGLLAGSWLSAAQQSL